MNLDLKSNIQGTLDYLLNLGIEDILKANIYTDLNYKNKIRTSEVLFPLGYFLHSISYVRPLLSDRQNEKVKKLIDYLYKENNHYSYNYFSKKYNKTNKQFLIPDDLDDTVLMLSAFIKNGIDIDEKFILKIISLETKVGGPYSTWYVAPTMDAKWKTIDPVVNANLLYTLSLLDIRLPKTHKYIVQCFNDYKVTSPYYVGDFFFYFNFARYLSVIKDKKLINELLIRIKKYKFNKLSITEKILYGLILNYLGSKLQKKELDIILKLQNPDGSINESIICTDFNYKDKLTYISNKASTSSLWLELITKEYLKSGLKIEKEQINNTLIKITTDTKEIISNQINKSKLSKELLKYIDLKENFKSIYIPVLIAQDLKKDLTVNDSKKLTNFCVAAFFGWMGYTILDNIIDDQKYSDDIMLVNFCLRLQYQYLHLVFGETDILEEAFELFNQTDEHYLWESKNTRLDLENLPNKFTYKYIENRMNSFLVLTSKLPYILKLNKSSEKSKTIYKVLRNVMIIDQLNDDAHDWEMDISNKVLTYVTYNLAIKTKIKSQMKKIFWPEIMPMILKICKKKYKEALKLIENSELDFINLRKILEKSYSPIDNAEKEVRKVNNMIKYYSK